MSSDKRRITENAAGFLFVIGAAILYGMYPIASKIAYANGATPAVLLVLKGTGLISYGLLGFLNKKIDMTPPCGIEAGRIALLSTMGAVLTPLMLLMSYQYIGAGTATVIHYLYCALTFVICLVFFKEKFDVLKAACVVLCSLGVFLLYFPGGGAKNALGMTFAVISAFTFAFYCVYIDKSGLHKLPSVKLQFYILTVSAPLSIIYALATGAFVNFTMGAAGWIVAIAYYTVGAATAGALFQEGIHRIGAEKAAIISTLEPLTSVLIGILIFDESLTWTSAAGMAVILVAATSLTLIDPLRKKRKALSASR